MILSFILAAVVSAPAPPSAEQYYMRAIEAMRNVAQPDFATYVVHVHITGLSFSLTRDPHGKASINLTLGRGNDATFAAAYRKSDDLTSAKTPQGWGLSLIHI